MSISDELLASMTADSEAAFAIEQARLAAKGVELSRLAIPAWNLGFAAGAAWVIEKLQEKGEKQE